jgi:hypothetical protein
LKTSTTHGARMRRSALAAAVGVCIGSNAFADDDISALRQQLQQMQARIEQLERDKAQNTTPPPAMAAPPSGDAVAAVPAQALPVTAGATKGSFKLPGSDTSVTIGGYVRGTVVYSDRSSGPANPGDLVLLPQTIPLSTAAFPPAEKDKVKFTAQESRIAIRTSTPSSVGLVTSYIEGDFFGTGGNEVATNSYGFRLRHAWATIGNLGFGQTWSNGVNFAAVPETIDFSPTIGGLGVPRQAGVRWTQPFERGAWSVALENPETYLSGAPTQPDNDQLPDLNAKVSINAAGGTFELLGLVRKLRADQAGVNNNVTGKGLNISGGLPLGAADKIVFSIGHGEGIGRYWGATPADAVVVGNSLQAIKTTGGYVGLRHRWTPSLRSSIDYSVVRMSMPAGAPTTIDRRFTAAHANLFWSVTPNSELAMEYLHADREILSGTRGTLNRLLFSGRVTY